MPTPPPSDWPIPARQLQRLLGRLRDEMAMRHGRARRAMGLATPGRTDLLAWGRRFLPEHFQQPPSAMHQWLARHLDAARMLRGMKLNVLGPRGGAKSTLVTLAAVLRAAVERAEPYIWIVSDTKHQAQAHLENVKAELAANRRLAEAYPETTGRGPVWRAGTIELHGGVVVEAYGTGQRIRGRRRRQHRPTLIVCDDLQNDGHITSARQRDRSRTWFHGTLLKAGTGRTNVVNLATALHREALAVELCAAPGWTARRFRAIERWPENTSLWAEWEKIYTAVDRPDYKQAARAFYLANQPEMDAGAVLLWPEVEGLYALMCMRAESGHTAFEREKQNSPINPEMCEWPETYFDNLIWFDEWPLDLQVRVLALDPSKGTDSRRGDYSALVALGVDRRGMLFVEADLRRRPTPQIVADAVEWHRTFRPDVFGVEANQFQHLLAGELDAAFRQAGILAARPVPIENRVNKQVRIRRLGPYLSSSRVRFKAGSPGTQLLVEQLGTFPVGDHDDGPDALEMAVRLAAELLNSRSDGLGSRLPVGR
ncbi:MAG: hypothetical protein RBS80_16150 [Thermoguttaceae bacterium]|jgi:predicted phage terminase large subunit-like protein|nr:hypothetical protein [Thermoguttaceae bacterium]